MLNVSNYFVIIIICIIDYELNNVIDYELNKHHCSRSYPTDCVNLCLYCIEINVFNLNCLRMFQKPVMLNISNCCEGLCNAKALFFNTWFTDYYFFFFQKI